MSQSDYNIANADGATVRADINSQLDAIGSQNSGSTAPPVTFPYMRWFDTANQQLKERNGANTAWRTVAEVIDGELVPYSAGQSADARYARLVGGADFDEAPTVGGEPLLTGETLAEAIATRNIATVRQTTERGPIDANGQPDLLEDAGGLQVQTKGISSSTPLVVVLTLNESEDYRVKITSNLGPWTLADDTDDQQLVIDVTPGQAPTLVVTPIWTYAEVAPSSPSAGDVWYNIWHWGLPKEWDGSEWIDKYYSIVGQASAASGSVVDFSTYAYKGFVYRDLGASFAGNGSILVDTKIGTDFLDYFFEVNRTEGFKTRISSNNAEAGTGNRQTVEVRGSGKIALNAQGAQYIVVATDGTASTYNWSGSRIWVHAKRSF